MIPREEKIRLSKNENSIGHLPVGCLQKNSPSTKQSFIILLFSPKKEVMLLPVSVCLSAKLLNV